VKNGLKNTKWVPASFAFCFIFFQCLGSGFGYVRFREICLLK